jgi:hypothetical protein
MLYILALIIILALFALAFLIPPKKSNVQTVDIPPRPHHTKNKYSKTYEYNIPCLKHRHIRKMLARQRTLKSKGPLS